MNFKITATSLEAPHNHSETWFSLWEAHGRSRHHPSRLTKAIQHTVSAVGRGTVGVNTAEPEIDIALNQVKDVYNLDGPRVIVTVTTQDGDDDD